MGVNVEIDVKNGRDDGESDVIERPANHGSFYRKNYVQYLGNTANNVLVLQLCKSLLAVQLDHKK